MTALYRSVGGWSFKMKIPSLVLLHFAVFPYFFAHFSRIASQKYPADYTKGEVFHFKIFCVHDRITDKGIELFFKTQIRIYL